MSWNKGKIKEWLRIAEGIKIKNNYIYQREASREGEETSPEAFPKFAMLWMVFNSLYNEENGANLKEFKKIQTFIKKNEEIHKQLYEEDSEYKKYIDKLKAMLDECHSGLKNLTGREKSSITSRPYPIKIEEPKNFSHVIDVIYTIRNNLFHGGKTETNTPRDKKLCYLSYNILKIFIEKYIKKQVEWP